MADGTVTLNVGTGGDVLDIENVVFGTAPTVRVRERLQVSGSLAAEIARVRPDAPDSADYGLVVRAVGQPNTAGAWSYKSATLTSGSLSAVGRCLGILVFAAGGDGSFKVSAGDTITVRSGIAISLGPLGNLVNPTVTWLSGTLDVYLEVVA